MLLQKVAQRSGVQQRPRIAAAEGASEGEVEDPDEGVVGLGDEVAAEDVGWFEVGPQIGQDIGGLGEVVASHGHGRAVDRSGRSATNDRKGIAAALDPSDLPESLENTRLISPAGSAARHG